MQVEEEPGYLNILFAKYQLASWDQKKTFQDANEVVGFAIKWKLTLLVYYVLIFPRIVEIHSVTIFTLIEI